MFFCELVTFMNIALRYCSPDIQQQSFYQIIFTINILSTLRNIITGVSITEPESIKIY